MTRNQLPEANREKIPVSSVVSVKNGLDWVDDTKDAVEVKQ